MARLFLQKILRQEHHQAIYPRDQEDALSEFRIGYLFPSRLGFSAITNLLKLFMLMVTNRLPELCKETRD